MRWFCFWGSFDCLLEFLAMPELIALVLRDPPKPKVESTTAPATTCPAPSDAEREAVAKDTLPESTAQPAAAPGFTPFLLALI